jgi:hypothetical protein
MSIALLLAAALLSDFPLVTLRVTTAALLHHCECIPFSHLRQSKLPSCHEARKCEPMPVKLRAKESYRGMALYHDS